MTWSGFSDQFWSSHFNWDPNIVPNGTSVTAEFSSPYSVIIDVDGDYSVERLQIDAGSDAQGAYSFWIKRTAHNPSSASFSLYGAGIVNQAASSPYFRNDGVLAFHDTASAANAVIDSDLQPTPTQVSFFDRSTAATSTINNIGGLLSFHNNATVGNATLENSANADFYDNASAGSSTITNHSFGFMTFHGNSTAGNATIAAETGAAVVFTDAASGGAARLIAQTGTRGASIVDISTVSTDGISVGSIEGAGTFNLGSKNLTAGSLNTSTTVSGVIQDGFSGSGGSLTKVGTGTLTFTGTNTYTGATTIKNGTLALDFSGSGAPASNIVAQSSPLVMAGGTLRVVGLSGTSNSQTFNGPLGGGRSPDGGLNVNAGASKIVLAPGSSNSLTLSFSHITHQTGGTLDFAIPNQGAVTYTTSARGLLGGWATVAENTWASVVDHAGSSTVGEIQGLSSYDTDWGAGHNTDIGRTAPLSTDPPPDAVTNTLRYNEATANTVTLVGTATIQSGGILVTANVGNHLSAITGGSLTSGGGELFILQNNTAAALEIDSRIVDSVVPTSLTKSGQGTLILGGANTYTGTTTVNEGKLEVDGTIAGDAMVNSGATLGGSLNVMGAITVAAGGVVSPGHSPGVITAGSGNLQGGGIYDWQVNTIPSAGTAGINWDSLVINGDLAVNATLDNPFVIRISSLTSSNAEGPLAGFDAGQAYTWSLIEVSGNLASSFDPGAFVLDDSQFASFNSFDGTFSLEYNTAGPGGEFDLIYSPVPEPSTSALVAFSLGAMVFATRRCFRPKERCI